MASIERRLVNDEPRYDVRYRDPSGRQRKKTFAKKGLRARSPQPWRPTVRQLRPS
jgi:hypothetical protein